MSGSGAATRQLQEASARRARAKLTQLRRMARARPWDGRSIPGRVVMDSLLEPGRPTSVTMTFDTGTHASGWWRNSEYDRCYHLSVCHVTATGVEACTVDEVRAWARAAFPRHYPWTWTESPLGLAGAIQSAERCGVPRYPNVAHVRLFCDQAGQPIKPTGEVYDLIPYADGTSPAKVFR